MAEVNDVANHIGSYPSQNGGQPVKVLDYRQIEAGVHARVVTVAQEAGEAVNVAANPPTFITVDFPNTGTATPVVNVQGKLTAIMASAAFLGDMTFEAGVTSGALLPMRDGNQERALINAEVAGAFQCLEPADWWGVTFLKLKSSVAQNAIRTITLVLAG